MNELDMGAITEFDWAGLLMQLQTSGVDFGLKLLVAVVIF